MLERRWKFEHAKQDARFAMLAFTIANCSGAKKEDGSSFKFDDFMPKTELQRKEEEQTPEQMLAILESMVASGNSR